MTSTPASQPAVAQEGLISTSSEILELVGELSTADYIALDTEFIRENTFFPQIEILQIATREKSWLLDARVLKSNDHKASIAPLLEILRSDRHLKILHAAQGDQECLFTAYGITATPSVDTMVLGSLCGFGDGVGLANLLKSVLNVQIKKGHARTDWTVRPLPAQLAEYAHQDVQYLVELGTTLLERAEKLKRKDWALEISSKWEEYSLYEPDPRELAEKLAKGGRLDKKTFGPLVELMKWREERVRKLNLPRRWVADDSVLLDLARVRPKDMDHLAAFRGLNKGELRNSGEAILAAIKRGIENKDVELPRAERVESPTAAEEQTLSLMKCFVGLLADQKNIAARNLLSAQQYLRILRTKPKTPAELKGAAGLSQTAVDLIGEELLAFLRGERALSVRDEAVEVVSVPQAAARP